MPCWGEGGRDLEVRPGPGLSSYISYTNDAALEISALWLVRTVRTLFARSPPHVSVIRSPRKIEVPAGEALFCQ